MDFEKSQYVNDYKIGMKWRIKENDLLNITDNSLESKELKANIPGVKYFLRIYPNGRDESEANEVTAFLLLEYEINKIINATFTISVKSASTNFKFSDGIYERPCGKGKVLCTREELLHPENNFFINGIMELELEGTLKTPGIEKIVLEPSALGNALWEEDDDDKDLTVIAQEQKIMVHKCILSLKSPVFKTELKSGFKEAQENKIEITDFSFDIVKTAMEFCYDRNITDQINDENASNLLRFSDKYNIESLHTFIQSLLIEKLSESNVCKFANMSITSNALELRESCLCFLVKAIGKSISGIEELDADFLKEIARRSYFPVSE